MVISGNREGFPSMRVDQVIDGERFTLYEHQEDRGWTVPSTCSDPMA
jgi:hypothetical protein